MHNNVLNIILKDEKNSTADIFLKAVYVLQEYEQSPISSIFNFHWLQSYLIMNDISKSIKSYDYCTNIENNIVILTKHSDEKIDF